MMTLKGWIAAVGAAALLGLAMPAVAQDGEPGTATAEEITGAGLTEKQKTDFVEATVEQLDEAKSRVLGMIEEAQKANDIILLNCLNEKLGLLKGLHKVAVDAEDGLAEAVARENADLQEHNFRKSFIAREQGETVAAEADACLGQVGTSFPGQTRVVVRFDGDPVADPDFGAAEGGNSRPPDASPTGE